MDIIGFWVVRRVVDGVVAIVGFVDCIFCGRAKVFIQVSSWLSIIGSCSHGLRRKINVSDLGTFWKYLLQDLNLSRRSTKTQK